MASPVTVLRVGKHDQYYCRECGDFIRPETPRDGRGGSPYVPDPDKAYGRVMRQHRTNAMAARRAEGLPRAAAKRLADVPGGDAPDADGWEGRR